MAVGDLVDPSTIRAPHLLVRLRARPSEPVTAAAGLTDNAMFTATRPDDLVTSRGWWRSLRNKFRRSSRRVPGSRFSLLAALNTITDFQVYGTDRGGVEAVAVPFGHVCLIAAAGACDFGPYASNTVRARIESEFGPFVDPMLGVAAALNEARDFGERQIMAFFGRSVFVPPREEQPVGRVTIERAAAATSGRPGDKVQPRLPDDRPAGLYRGQAGLAFARSDLAAPATSSLLPAGAVAFILSGQEGADGLDLAARDMTMPDGAFDEAAAMPIVRRGTVAPGEDAAFDVFDVASGDKMLRIAATLDVRPSRFNAEMPGDAGFAIVGILAPLDDDRRVLDRWWIDLDRSDRLVASAMTWRATTVVCTDDTVEVYDWSERRFDRALGSRFELSTVATEAGERSILRRSDNEPLGFIAVPPRTMAASFDHRWWRAEGWHLDWLDFAGAVETPAGDTRRLAADTALTQSLPWMPGSGGGVEDLAKVIAREAGHHIFVTGWSGRLEPGTAFLVGPLVLSFRTRGSG
jgi:hypothetical protein